MGVSMKGWQKALVVVGIVLVVIVALYSLTAGNYNKIVERDEAVNAQWAEVQNQYQRRLDLVPNLVSTVKGYAAHEEKVFTEVAEARSRAGGTVKIDTETLEDTEAFKKYQQAQDSLGSSLQRLLVVSEQYPQLTANENFRDLQSQLEGTENRITVARGRYNDAARSYNVFIRQFPRSIIANMNGFRAKAYFEASEQAASAPKVEF